MSSQFPPRGGFEESPLHELVVKLIRGRFSGSIEVRSATTVRIFHFDSGNLCAATSDHPNEQIDTLLERTITPTLSKEEKRLVRERIEGGQPFARALVDLGVLHATELLAYNRNLAEEILRGALADSPTEYRSSPGRPAQYNPVPFDPLAVVRESVLNDLDEETIESRLGDNSTVFTATGKTEDVKSSFNGDAELDLIISNLDGRKSIGEMAGRLGMNPDRTRRLLYFLYLLGGIAPIAERPDLSHRVVPGRAGAYADGELPDALVHDDDDTEGILRLLEKQEAELAGSQPGGGKDMAFHRSLEEQLGDSAGSEIPHEDSSLTNGPTAESEAIRRQGAPPGFFNLLYKLWLPAVVVAVIVLVYFIMLTTAPKKAPGGKISFYKEDVDTAQFRLDDDFTSRPDREIPAIQLPLDKQTEAETEPAIEPEPQQSQAAAPAGEAEEQPTQETAVSEQPPSQEAGELEREPMPDFADFASAHSVALPLGHRGDWSAATRLWRAGVEAESGKPYTLMIRLVDKPLYISDIFEHFANSARLRNSFFVLRSESGYAVCWGLFADSEAAQAALDALPAAIRSLGPRTARVSSLLTSR